MSETSHRKKEHLDITMNHSVDFLSKTNGFENYDFEHDASVDFDFNSIDLSTTFLSKKISYPFLVSSMTGGTAQATEINEQLSIVANELNLPIGTGSVRQLLEDKKFVKSFLVFRQNAKLVPILANIGAAQICSINDFEKLFDILSEIDANSILIHLNPLQEIIQKNGQPEFERLIEKIEELTSKSPVPIFVKEVGFGIGKKAAKKLLNAGVQGIDVAGAGGTNWAKIESIRSGNDDPTFWDWGLPTSYCIRTVSKLKSKHSFTLIASGGISSGTEISKAIALGADLTASAAPIIRSLKKNGVNGLIELLKEWFHHLQVVMFLTASKNIEELKNIKLLKKEDLH